MLFCWLFERGQSSLGRAVSTSETASEPCLVAPSLGALLACAARYVAGNLGPPAPKKLSSRAGGSAAKVWGTAQSESLLTCCLACFAKI